MLGKKASPKIDEAVAKAVNYEISVADLAKRSERRAWIVASVSVVVSLILIGGYFYILPLKEKVPYLIMADAYTGTSSVSRVVEDVSDQRLSANEAINRSNITHFVLARESYDANMIQLRDWDTVLTMSSPTLATAYTALHAPTNPARPFAIYGRDRALRVKVLSIQLIPSLTPGAAPIGATVRFQRSIYNKQNGATTPLDSKIATLAFKYKPNLRMDDRYRVENPLGFQVFDYRVDNDYSDAPPAEVPATADATTGAAAPAPAASTAPPEGTLPPANAAAPPTEGAPAYAVPATAPAAPVATPNPPNAQPANAAPAAAGRPGSVNGVRR
ncbi:type IV secretion system protein [Bacillus sp. NP157]|nr:type IV secretion system protein [Bacillus sp. NP157]